MVSYDYLQKECGKQKHRHTVRHLSKPEIKFLEAAHGRDRERAVFVYLIEASLLWPFCSLTEHANAAMPLLKRERKWWKKERKKKQRKKYYSHQMTFFQTPDCGPLKHGDLTTPSSRSDVLYRRQNVRRF